MVACPDPGGDLTVHEVARIFPELPPARYCALKASIAAIGQIDPVWLHPDGRIIDGRHRYRACRELGMEPRLQTWDGAGSLMGFVCALNALSRHLTLSQKVAVAAEMVPHFEREARQRQATSGPGIYGGKPLSAKVRQAVRSKAAERAARELAVGTRYVEYGLRLQRTCPELLPPLCSGHLELALARRLALAERERRQGYLDLAAAVPDPDPHTTPREVHLRYCQVYGSLKDNLDAIKPSDWWAFGRPKEEFRQPEGFEGSIPGEVYANALYYFAPARGIAVDVMAGSGMLRRVYDKRERWQWDRRFDLDVHLFDLHPCEEFAASLAIARHDAMGPLPFQADWIFVDPPYYMAEEQRYYQGALATARDYATYLALLGRVITAMAASLRPRGRLLLFLPKTSSPADQPVRDVPRDATRLALEAGLTWLDRAYVSRGKQQHPKGAVLNREAKRNVRMMSDVCELNVFERRDGEG